MNIIKSIKKFKASVEIRKQTAVLEADQLKSANDKTKNYIKKINPEKEKGISYLKFDN